jgi:adenosylcobinamide amidohydrolase
LTAVAPVSELHHGGPDCVACLVWRLDTPLLAASTAPVGGGIGRRDWVVNAQVPRAYRRRDVDAHVRELAEGLGLAGHGVGMLTAADVGRGVRTLEGGVRVEATVGLTLPVWAAAPCDADRGAAAPDPAPVRPGTINVVAFVPVRHTDAALANLLCTVTEAKAQALFEGGVAGTGTASDAVTVLCPADGDAEPFGGPRSTFGARVARAVHAAVGAGMADR